MATLTSTGDYRPETRLRWLRTAVALAFIGGIALSPRLWLSEARDYPLVPVSEALPQLATPTDAWLLGVLAASLLAAAIMPPSRVPLAVALAVALGLAVLDQNRWQPWVYQYMLMLAALAFASPRHSGETDAAARALGICAFIMVTIYFWSGLSKIGAAFRLDVFPFLLEPVLGPVPPWLAPFTYVVPVAEMSIGLGLIWRRTRLYALVGAVLMHAFILLSIGPLGRNWNSVVWPWNVAMVAFVFLLFWRLNATPDRQLLAHLRRWPPASRAFAALVAVLVGVLPALNLFGRWESYLSAELYSGATLNGYVLPSNATLEHLPVSARRSLVGRGDQPVLSLFRWAIGDLNVPPYPARRVYKGVAGRMCSEPGTPRALLLVIKERPDLVSGRRKLSRYGCKDLARSEYPP